MEGLLIAFVLKPTVLGEFLVLSILSLISPIRDERCSCKKNLHKNFLRDPGEDHALAGFNDGQYPF